MKGRQGIIAGYNAQAMVSPIEPDEGPTGMLVTAVDVVDQPSDNDLLIPMMATAEVITGTKVNMTLADAGYFATAHLAECALRGQQVAMPDIHQRNHKNPYHKDRFIYNQDIDSFTCPMGQRLRFSHTESSKKWRPEAGVWCHCRCLPSVPGLRSVYEGRKAGPTGDDWAA